MAKSLIDWNDDMSKVFDECRSKRLPYKDAETLTNIAGKGIKALASQHEHERFMALLDLKTAPGNAPLPAPRKKLTAASGT